jgi:hypothetical protein
MSRAAMRARLGLAVFGCLFVALAFVGEASAGGGRLIIRDATP